MSKQRILLVHNFYQSSAPSGEDTVYLSEKALLEKSGFEILAYERHNDGLNNLNSLQMADVALSATWARDTYREIADLLSKFRPHIAHFHNTFPLISPSAYVACQENNVRVVQTLHNYRLICPGALLLRNGRSCEDCLNQSLLPALKHKCYRQSLSATGSIVLMLLFHRWRGTYRTSVDRYIALTRFAADKLAMGGLPPDKITVKPNFLPAPLVPKTISKKENYAVYVGRLSNEKGIKALISAWGKVRSLPLKVVGDGPLRAELERIVGHESLDIKFLGAVKRETVLDIVRRASLQIVPSICYEGFPLAIVEAYACGTPVVASRIGSIIELVRLNQTGLLFSPGNEQDIVEKVDQALRLSKLQRWSEKARKTFEDYYSETMALEQLRQIYSSLVDNKSPIAS